MKYIIEIPDERERDYIAETPFGKRLFFPLRITDVAYSLPTHLHVEEYTDVNREEIENEVWEFARGLLNYIDDDWEAIANMLLLDIPYQEAKAKYDAWKKEQQEVRVGDEVRCMDRVGIVVRIDSMDGGSNVVWEDGATAYIGIKDLTKTDRHFDEVDELLKKMRGEQE